MTETERVLEQTIKFLRSLESKIMEYRHEYETCLRKLKLSKLREAGE